MIVIRQWIGAAFLLGAVCLAPGAATAGASAPGAEVSTNVTPYLGGYNWDYTVHNTSQIGSGEFITKIEIPLVFGGELTPEPPPTTQLVSQDGDLISNISVSGFFFATGWAVSGGVAPSFGSPGMKDGETATFYLTIAPTASASIAPGAGLDFNFFSPYSEATEVQAQFDVMFSAAGTFVIDPPVPNPEPSSIAILAVGLGALWSRRRGRA